MRTERNYYKEMMEMLRDQDMSSGREQRQSTRQRKIFMSVEATI